MTREPEFNGMFYPDDPKRLKNMIREFLENVPEPTLEDTTGLKAIIVPHAGYVFSGLTAAYAYKLIPRDTERIILIGPSHRYPIQGPVASDENWKTPLGEIKGEALDSTGMTIDNRAHRGEHSLEVQLPFLQMILDNDFTIMPIAVNRSDTEGTARLLLEHLDDNTLLVISSDLSHFYDLHTAKQLDDSTSHDITNLDLEGLSDDEACGLEGIRIAVRMAQIGGWKVKELHRSTSADGTGDTTKVVGYGSYGFFTRE